MAERIAAELITERLRLERLDPGQEEVLQAVFRAAGDHFTTVTGRPEPDPEAARRELRSAEEVEGREVFLIRLQEGDEAVGAVGFWERHPQPDVALLGMLLIDVSHRKRGYAREALQAVEDALRGRGIVELRTGVGAGDVARHAALRALGFEPLDERRHVSLDRGRVMIALFHKQLLERDD
ncbi:MAG TPA: GNAT family N-acetyltransferase [Longimicrobiaceae bacterium]